MSTNLKISAIILALLMIFSVLMSCQKEDGGKTDTTASTSSNAGTTNTGDTTDDNMDNLGEFDFGGYVFRVRSTPYVEGDSLNLFEVTEQSSDPVYQSLYYRNREIEERFKIKFECTEDSYQNNLADLQHLYSAGEDSFDLINILTRDAIPSAVDGMIMPVSELTYLDTSRSYYLDLINDSLTICGKQYVVASEMATALFDATCCILYNTEISEDIKVGSLYDEVRENTWTYDRMFEVAMIADNDLNEEGKVWGIVGAKDIIYPEFWVCANAMSITKDENDEPYFSATNQKFIDVISYSVNKLKDTECTLVDTQANVENLFMSDQAYLLVNMIGKLSVMREMESNYGIIPFPKYDSNQEEYYSRVCGGRLHVVPSVSSNAKMISVIMEALASGTARYVNPAYYEKTFQQKIMRNYEDDMEMFEIIRNGRVCDLGEMIWLTARSQISNKIFVPLTTEFTSILASMESEINGLITKVTDEAKKSD